MLELDIPVQPPENEKKNERKKEKTKQGKKEGREGGPREGGSGRMVKGILQLEIKTHKN